MSGGERYSRLVREVEDVVTRERRQVAHAAIDPLPLKPEHVQVILQGMQQVTQGGTGTRVFAGTPYVSGGKTGTAQAVGVRANEKYNAAKLEEHKRDHALYISFAPVEAPRVALAVVVENAGFGAASAAPIARRVMDYLLVGKYPSVEDIASRAGQVRPAVGVAAPPRRCPPGAVPMLWAGKRRPERAGRGLGAGGIIGHAGRIGCVA